MRLGAGSTAIPVRGAARRCFLELLRVFLTGVLVFVEGEATEAALLDDCLMEYCCLVIVAV